MKQYSPTSHPTVFRPNPINEAALKMAGVMPVKEICSAFGITERRLRAAAAYRKISLAFEKPILKTPWTAEEVRILTTKASTHTAVEVAAELGRTEQSVKGKARLLGVSFRKHGENSPNAKHSNYDIELCRQLNEAGLRPYQIAQKMEIELSHLCKILKYEARYRELGAA